MRNFFVQLVPVLEFCHEENTYFVGDVLQLLELRAASHLLLLAQVYFLAVELGELALEHEAVFLLRMVTSFTFSLTGSFW